MKIYNETFNYKLIYVIRINAPTHSGLLKIGDTTVKTDLSPDKLPPNCSTLNKAARERIKIYTNTAGVEYELLHTELAIKTNQSDVETTVVAFRDKEVHSVLERSGYNKVKIGDTTGQEWFRIDYSIAIEAINAVKSSRKMISQFNSIEKFNPILFRPEQKEAIIRTVKQFKKSDRMLWNAKMRFGKTLCALEVVKQMNFKRTIIVTHRPVVKSGWYDDFIKIFFNNNEYIFGSKADNIKIVDLEEQGANYVYFVSVQDLRGSEKVGGKFNKNDEVFGVDWDFVVVDEAHEGTKTSLGENVVTELLKEDTEHTTKLLALSGTPFNILHEYKEEELYTWDYIMEQQAKKDWEDTMFGDSNPYEELPKINIFTYNLGKLLGNGQYEEIEDKAFNFREFFRTWNGNPKIDKKQMPQNASVGDFVHKQDVNSFLNLITKHEDNSNYPYAKDEYRELFKHSLWMLPGVKEAKALSQMMKSHPVFGSGMFDIVNVAGDGDDEEESKDALKLVKESISTASKMDRYTITLSCGKLTTGVTIPEWTAVMMLSGSYSTSAANYLQTIFRVQSPANVGGKIKDNCYVFDFAPDRTLKMVADAVNLSAKAGKTSQSDRLAMGEFLNFCPVISIDGTEMRKYDESNLLQQLKRAYAERAVKNGFDDTSIYNDIELSKLTENDLRKFAELRKIVGSSKAQSNTEKIDINKTGLTNEEYEELEKVKDKQPRERTAEEQAIFDELKEKQSNRSKAISNLRAISIRIPLLIYGADVDFDDDITAEKIVDIVDDASWDEFMPNGITKELYKDFIKYYDTDVFIAAGRRIKSIVKHADTLAPTERVQKITELFKGFKNPDKETVLTPWRVVNMHMSDCLGGYDFFDINHEETIETPRYVDRGQVTEGTFANKNAKILEINSKSGLYPLYATYSIFRAKCNDIENTSIEEQNRLWEETVRDNVFVICKTPMAKAITKRTLCGYKNIKVNSHYFDDLINKLKYDSTSFVTKVLKPGFWNLKGSEQMKFDAIIGNPPYQVIDGGGVGSSAIPVYNNFVETAINLNPEYLSMIMPARWFSGGRGLDAFRDKMLNDKRLQVIHDYLNSKQMFSEVEIKGGICYFLWHTFYSGDCNIYSHKDNSIFSHKKRPLLENGMTTFIRNNEMISIIHKVKSLGELSLSSIISANDPFGFDVRENSSYKRIKPNFSKSKSENSISFYYNGWRKDGIGYIDYEKVRKGLYFIDKPKVLIPKAWGTGKPELDWLNPFIPEEKSCCTETYLVVGEFIDYEHANNFISYTQTKFFHIMVSVLKITQNTMQGAYHLVPIQDFSKPWTDKELYSKYELLQEEIDFIENKIKPME